MIVPAILNDPMVIDLTGEELRHDQSNVYRPRFAQRSAAPLRPKSSGSSVFERASAIDWLASTSSSHAHRGAVA